MRHRVPGYGAAMSEHEPEHIDQEEKVSEVSGLDPEDADAPIAPEDATAGDPGDESGQAQEGTAGPNAAPRHDPPEDDNRSAR